MIWQCLSDDSLFCSRFSNVGPSQHLCAKFLQHWRRQDGKFLSRAKRRRNVRKDPNHKMLRLLHHMTRILISYRIGARAHREMMLDAYWPATKAGALKVDIAEVMGCDISHHEHNSFHVDFSVTILLCDNSSIKSPSSSSSTLLKSPLFSQTVGDFAWAKNAFSVCQTSCFQSNEFAAGAQLCCFREYVCYRRQILESLESWRNIPPKMIMIMHSSLAVKNKWYLRYTYYFIIIHSFTMKAMSGSIVYVWAARIRGQCCNAPLLSLASIRLSRDDRLIHSLVVHNATFIFNVSTARNVIFLLQEYSFQITLRQQWNDGRLSFKNRIFGMEGKLKAQLKYYVFSSRNFFFLLGQKRDRAWHLTWMKQ